MKTGRWKRWTIGAVLGIVLAAVFYAARGVVLPPLAGWLDVGERPSRVDYVLPLPGDATTRAVAAAVAVQDGIAGRVLVLETAIGPEVEDQILPPDHEIVTAVLRRLGVPADRIEVLHGRTATTFTDVQRIRAFLEEHPQATLAVVTNDYHSRRARWALARVAGPESKRIHWLTAPSDDFEMDRWWQNADGFRIVVAENLSLIAYGFCYGTLGAWLLAVVGIAGIAVIARRRMPWRPRRREAIRRTS